jgi:flagellar assembly protein FliH
MPSSSSRVLEIPTPGSGPRPEAGGPPPRPRPLVRPVEPLLTPERLMQLEREAYEAGFAAGDRAGRETGEATARELVEAIEALRSAVQQTREALLPEAERDVLHLALATARAVLGYEVAQDHPVVAAGVAAAREHFSPRTPLTVRIHPADRDVLESHRAGLTEGLATDFEVVSDPAVARGGALVEGEGRVIDAGLITRFEEVIKSLVERLET